MSIPSKASPSFPLLVFALVAKCYPLVVVAAVWELAARLQWVDPLFLPRFSGVVAALWDGLFGAGFLLTDASYSVLRAIAALAIGGGIGLVLETLMGEFRPARQFLDRLVSLLFPMPKMALFLLLMVWLGLGESSKVGLIAISAFFCGGNQQLQRDSKRGQAPDLERAEQRCRQAAIAHTRSGPGCQPIHLCGGEGGGLLLVSHRGDSRDASIQHRFGL